MTVINTSLFKSCAPKDMSDRPVIRPTFEKLVNDPEDFTMNRPKLSDFNDFEIRKTILPR